MKISILIQYRSTFNKSQHVRIKFLLSFHIYFRNSIGLSIYHTSSKNSALLKYSAPLDSIGPSSFSKGRRCFSLLSFYLGHSAPILDKIHVESCTQRSPKHRKFADFFSQKHQASASNVLDSVSANHGRSWGDPAVSHNPTP